jgi:hypothetical protein
LLAATAGFGSGQTFENFQGDDNSLEVISHQDNFKNHMSNHELIEQVLMIF